MIVNRWDDKFVDETRPETALDLVISAIDRGGISINTARALAVYAALAGSSMTEVAMLWLKKHVPLGRCNTIDGRLIKKLSRRYPGLLSPAGACTRCTGTGQVMHKWTKHLTSCPDCGGTGATYTLNESYPYVPGLGFSQLPTREEEADDE